MAELTPYILVEESIIRSELTPYVLAGESIVSADVCLIVIAAHERVSAGIKLYAIAVFEESGEEQIEFSTGRSVVIGCEISLPVERNIVCTDTVNADTFVSGVESVKRSFLANRHIHAIDEVLADTIRTMASGTVSESVSATTCREVNRSDVSTFDTSVRTYKEDVILSGTSRQIISSHFSDSISCSTRRSVLNDAALHFVTARSVSIAHELYFATSRSTGIVADVSFTSVRKIPYITTIVANTSPPRNPFIIEKALPKPGMVSMSITLNALSLSDIFEMETTLPISILSPIKGKILDYEYAYVADEVYWKDTVRNVSGMYDCDAILFTPMRYSSTEDKYSIAYHATRIAAALGKKLNFVADNFTHSGTWTGNGQTYNSIISSLFGWTSSVPQRQINVFMRAKDNSLNIIQRGKEKIVTDITDTHHTRPEYKQELERTLWSTKSSGEEIKAMCAKLPNVLCEPQGFTGTMSFGDSSASYSNGYLMSESKGDERTTYSYIGSVNTGKYLSRKSTSHADGSSTTTVYSYSSTASGAKVLGRESETHIDKDGNITTRDTYHVPLGNGFYGSSVSVDGESAGSSISTGSPSGAASRYIVQQESYTFGGYKAQISGDSDHMNNYDGDGFIDYQSFPVEEESMLLMLTNAVKWLNRKVKETVTMEIYGYSHVLDFTERLRFNGAEYFLESNTITQTVRELKQSVTMVRWF